MTKLNSSVIIQTDLDINTSLHVHVYFITTRVINGSSSLIDNFIQCL